MACDNMAKTRRSSGANRSRRRRSNSWALVRETPYPSTLLTKFWLAVNLLATRGAQPRHPGAHASLQGRCPRIHAVVAESSRQVGVIEDGVAELRKRAHHCASFVTYLATVGVASGTDTIAHFSSR